MFFFRAKIGTFMDPAQWRLLDFPQGDSEPTFYVFPFSVKKTNGIENLHILHLTIPMKEEVMNYMAVFFKKKGTNKHLKELKSFTC